MCTNADVNVACQRPPPSNAGSCSPSADLASFAAFNTSRSRKYSQHALDTAAAGDHANSAAAASDAPAAAAAAPPAIEHALTTNQDFFIANKAFFIDLSIWGDEAPIDDPSQPLGTDRNTLLAIIGAAYNQTQLAGAADGKPKLTHVGGFVPWLYKYVSRKSPLATKNLLKVTDGLRRPP